MKLYLKRSQREAGLMGGKIFFALDARIELTDLERLLIKRYKLGRLSVYNSEATRKYAQQGLANLATGNVMGVAKAALNFGLAHLNLTCTIDSLCEGQHIECKDMEELLAAEQAIGEACATAKLFLDTAMTFDGREAVLEF